MGHSAAPSVKDRTFFFFSYEGLRLRLPQTALTFVPDTSPLDHYSRQFATPALQPYLNAFPLPNGPEILDPQLAIHFKAIAQFNASYSNPGTLDAYSLRVDHKLNDRLNSSGVTIIPLQNSLSAELVRSLSTVIADDNHDPNWNLGRDLGDITRCCERLPFQLQQYGRFQFVSLGQLRRRGPAGNIAIPESVYSPQCGISLFRYSRSETTAASLQGQVRTTSNGKSISWTAYPYKRVRIA